MEEQNRLLCEKVLNESWSKVEKYTNDIRSALEKDELSERGLVLIKMAARAFVQKSMMDRADTISIFGIDLYSTSLCGMNSIEDCPCDRDKCLLDK